MNKQGIGMTSQRTRNRLIERLQQAGISNHSVLESIAKTPRHLFIEEALAHRAYEDTALPIGFGQTISQPYTVARMSEIILSKVSSCSKILELGTGCGYQTSILAPHVGWIYSIERIQGLHLKAKQHLAELGITNISLKLDDGHLGWAAHAPYDAIIGAAAAKSVPAALCQQLKEGGCLLMPIGEKQQMLTQVTRHGESVTTQVIEPANFVPFLSGTEC